MEELAATIPQRFIWITQIKPVEGVIATPEPTPAPGVKAPPKPTTPAIAPRAITAIEINGLYLDNPPNSEGAGVIDKFLGDGLMALFNAPSQLDGHAAAACRAAVEAIGELGESGAGKSYVPRVRVGLNGGEALAGNIGTSERFSYTAIGDCVNLASRLEGMNKFYGTSVIASAAIRRAAGDADFVWRALDRVAVVGRKEPLEIFELVGLRASVGEGKLKMVGVFARALELYFAKKFAEACELLGEIEGVDSAARVLLSRARESVAHPPTENWDGVFRADHK
jgi:hypothetical protein